LRRGWALAERCSCSWDIVYDAVAARLGSGLEALPGHALAESDDLHDVWAWNLKFI